MSPPRQDSTLTQQQVKIHLNPYQATKQTQLRRKTLMNLAKTFSPDTNI